MSVFPHIHLMMKVKIFFQKSSPESSVQEQFDINVIQSFSCSSEAKRRQ